MNITHLTFKAIHVVLVQGSTTLHILISITEYIFWKKKQLLETGQGRGAALDSKPFLAQSWLVHLNSWNAPFLYANPFLGINKFFHSFSIGSDSNNDVNYHK